MGKEVIINAGWYEISRTQTHRARFFDLEHVRLILLRHISPVALDLRDVLVLSGGGLRLTRAKRVGEAGEVLSKEGKSWLNEAQILRQAQDDGRFVLVTQYDYFLVMP